MLESAYEECLCHELSVKGLTFKRQVALPISYKGIKLDCSYRMDLVVDERLIVEVKTVEKILPTYEAQLLTYLKLTGIRTGLITNFNVPVLKDGIRRMKL